MSITVVISIICIVLAYLGRFKRSVFKYGLEASFFVLTVFLALRFDFGNDYQQYLIGFNDVWDNYSHDWKDIVSNIFLLRYEIGWHVLCLLLHPFGFFGLVIIVTIVENILLYKFIKRNTSPNFYWLAIFIYVFSCDLLLTQASAMRQWLATCIFIYSTRFISEKKPFHYFGMILLATCFHKTAIILAPIYLVRYLCKIKLSSITIIFVVPLLVIWYYYIPLLVSDYLPFLLAAESLDDMNQYLGESMDVSFSVVGLIFIFVPPLLCLSKLNDLNEQQRILVIIYFMYILVYPLAGVVMMAIRLGFYNLAVAIVAIPIVAEKYRFEKNPLLFLLIGLVSLGFLKGYIEFLSNSIWAGNYEYSTILSQKWQ